MCCHILSVILRVIQFLEKNSGNSWGQKLFSAILTGHIVINWNLTSVYNALNPVSH